MTHHPARRRATRLAGGVLTVATVLAGCGQGDNGRADHSDSGEVTVANCGKDVTFPQPAKRMYVYDGGIIAMTLAVGAADQIAGTAALEQKGAPLAAVYGKDVVDSLPVATDGQPTLENVLAQKPDLFFAGWNYGYDPETNLTPDGLDQYDIPAYTLSESCRQGSDGARGTMSPWHALFTDLTNLGKITGHQRHAHATVDDIKTRLDELTSAPQPDDQPTVFLFDSGTKDAQSSGSFGGPEAIIEAAGGRNALADIDDTWTTVSWERVAKAKPDFIAFNDYGDQSLREKINVLRNNPATKDLPAVKEERFLNIPYAAWVSSPLNIDAAEQLRNALEKWDLAPQTDIEPEHDVTG